MKFKLVPIKKIDTYEVKNEQVFDLEVKDNHSYNINGIVVHNSQCETRKVTGVSYPQISAAIECSKVAHGLKSGDKRLGLICLDGGFKEIGDFAKGFIAGADFCMSGSFFAGTDECCGEWLWENGKKIYTHYGMSSHFAQDKHEGFQKKYRASEGKVSKIVAKGPVGDIISEIHGGLRSTATYIGTDNIKDFSKCGKFVCVR